MDILRLLHLLLQGSSLIPTLRESLLSVLTAVQLVMGQEGAGMAFLARNSLVSRVCGSLSEADNANG